MIPELFMGGDLFCNSYNPCSNCQENCDFTADCKGDMKCYHRNDGDPGPPGCGGTSFGAADYFG